MTKPDEIARFFQLSVVYQILTFREGVATPYKLPTLLSLLTLCILLTIHCLHMGHTYFAIWFERFKHVAQNGLQELLD